MQDESANPCSRRRAWVAVVLAAWVALAGFFAAPHTHTHSHSGSKSPSLSHPRCRSEIAHSQPDCPHSHSEQDPLGPAQARTSPEADAHSPFPEPEPGQTHSHPCGWCDFLAGWGSVPTLNRAPGRPPLPSTERALPEVVGQLPTPVVRGPEAVRGPPALA